MWETRTLRFPRKQENPRSWFWGFSCFRHFHGPFSCCGPKLLKEFAFGLLHMLGGLSVAEGSGHALQDGQAHAGAQISCGLGECEQSFTRSLVAQVAAPAASFLVSVQLGLGAGTMEVQIGIEVVAVELLQRLSLGGLNIAVADVLADHGAVLGFHQAVIVTVSGTAFGLPDEQLVEELGHGGIDELAAVVGMK